jgi:hypothetical protein
MSELLTALVARLVLLPALWLLATPLVLLFGIIGQRSYWANVRASYLALADVVFSF